MNLWVIIEFYINYGMIRYIKVKETVYMTSAYKTVRSDKFISTMMIIFGICETIIALLAISGGTYRLNVGSLFYLLPIAVVGMLSIFCGMLSLKTGSRYLPLKPVFTLCLFVLAFLVSILGGLVENWLYSIPIVQSHELIMDIIAILFLLLYSIPALLAAFSVGPIAAIIVSASRFLTKIEYFFIYDDIKKALFIITARLAISVAVVSCVTYRYGYGRNVKRLLLSLLCGLTDGMLVTVVFSIALRFVMDGKLMGPDFSSIILFVLACVWHAVIIWDGKRNLSKKEINE